MGGMTNNLLSGLFGAFLAQLTSILWVEWKRCRDLRALLRGIIAECDYNLSIVDEILNGAVNHKGSFKRMSVEFFRSAREDAVKYSDCDGIPGNVGTACREEFVRCFLSKKKMFRYMGFAMLKCEVDPQLPTGF